MTAYLNTTYPNTNATSGIELMNNFELNYCYIIVTQGIANYLLQLTEIKSIFF